MPEINTESTDTTNQPAEGGTSSTTTMTRTRENANEETVPVKDSSCFVRPVRSSETGTVGGLRPAPARRGFFFPPDVDANRIRVTPTPIPITFPDNENPNPIRVTPTPIAITFPDNENPNPIRLTPTPIPITFPENQNPNQIRVTPTPIPITFPDNENPNPIRVTPTPIPITFPDNENPNPIRVTPTPIPITFPDNENPNPIRLTPTPIPITFPENQNPNQIAGPTLPHRDNTTQRQETTTQRRGFYFPQNSSSSSLDARRHCAPSGQPSAGSSSVDDLPIAALDIQGIQNQSKQIKVKKDYKLYDHPDAKVPTYSTRSKHRGYVLIINNIDFPGKQYRAGSEIDEADLKELFKQMGFTVISHQNKNKKDMKSIIKEHTRLPDLENVDISVTIIMSHGHLRGMETYIEALDGEHLETEWIVQQFLSENCNYLKGKPKIFIFQCCRPKQADIHEDSTTEGDVLIAYATIPGHPAYRNPSSGAWYLQNVCDIFMEHAYNTHVESLLKMVNEKLAKMHPKYKQICSYECRGFKKCFLNPQ